jgi:hypothetical protein
MALSGRSPFQQGKQSSPSLDKGKTHKSARWQRALVKCSRIARPPYSPRCNTLITCGEDNSPPRAVVMPRSFKAAAIWRRLVFPSALIASISRKRVSS